MADFSVAKEHLSHCMGSCLPTPTKRVVIFTGTSEALLQRIAPRGFELPTLDAYNKTYVNMSQLLDIPVPVVVALN